MTKRSSVNTLIEILREFPLKTTNLNEKTTLNDSINLFGSLMLQRVRSLLLDYFPYADFTNLSENSSIHEISLMISGNDEIAEKIVADPKDRSRTYDRDLSSQNLTNLNFKNINNGIVSVGIDIESIKVFPSDAMLPSGASFRANTFCPREIGYASTRNSPIQTLLGIFCAKEAVVKCCLNLERLNFRDIEITHDSKGRPLCNVPKYKDYNFQISISHTSEYACAFAIMMSFI